MQERQQRDSESPLHRNYGQQEVGAALSKALGPWA